jgi:hypothetical protein
MSDSEVFRAGRAIHPVERTRRGPGGLVASKDPLELRTPDFNVARPHQSFLTMSDQRSSLCADDVSSTRVEIVHTCPDGSTIRPVRSPQN